MLREFVQEIAAKAVDAAGPQFKELEPTTSVAVVEDGKIKIIEGRAERRDHHAMDLQTVVAFAIRFEEESAIWYSRSGVTCIINDQQGDDQRALDSVGLALTKSEPFNQLQLWDNKRPLMSQRDIMYSLRTTFADCTEKYPNLQKQFAKIDWEAGAKTSAELGRGKSSIGKTVKAEAGGLDDLPEQVTLTVPVFVEYFARKTFDVRCALEVHESEQKFQLFPLPGEIEKATANAEAEISSMILSLLGDKTIPLYYGNP